MQNYTFVYYTVVQDNDQPLTPNAFILSTPANNITVKDIKKSFPHKDKCTYLFRFRISPDGQPNTWIDLEDSEQVPHFGQTVYIKINRLGKYQPRQSKKQPVIQQQQKHAEIFEFV